MLVKRPLGGLERPSSLYPQHSASPLSRNAHVWLRALSGTRISILGNAVAVGDGVAVGRDCGLGVAVTTTSTIFSTGTSLTTSTTFSTSTGTSLITSTSTIFSTGTSLTTSITFSTGTSLTTSTSTIFSTSTIHGSAAGALPQATADVSVATNAATIRNKGLRFIVHSSFLLSNLGVSGRAGAFGARRFPPICIEWRFAPRVRMRV